MNAQDTEQTRWGENVIIADADYINKVAFDMTVNFERMIGRRIPPADFAQWVECVALDGGLRPGDHRSTVILLFNPDNVRMDNFTPGDLTKELSGRAFKGALGEFAIQAFPAVEIVGKEGFLLDVVQMICTQQGVKRVMIVPDADNNDLYARLRNQLARLDDDDKRITVFAMEPKAGGNFRQEILGYSLLSALGVKSEELHGK